MIRGMLPAQRVVACLKFDAFCKMHRRRGCSLLRAKREPEKHPLLSRRGRRRVAAPCVCFVPCVALASCRPLPQQLLPVSAAGSGRRCCTLAILSGNFNIYICVLEMTAVISRTLFHGQGRNGQRHPSSYSRKYPDEKYRGTICCICRSGPLP